MNIFILILFVCIMGCTGLNRIRIHTEFRADIFYPVLYLLLHLYSVFCCQVLILH